MTVAVHARYMGRPGRFPALKKFVEYIVGLGTFTVSHSDSMFQSSKEGVWVATREEIARHFAAGHPYKPASA